MPKHSDPAPADDVSWRPEIPQAARPVYLAIADALAADIAAGKLAAGARLPPQRRLADDLGLDFTTITRAYAEARRRGLVDGKVGQGTYVRARHGAPAARSGMVDMSMNLPPHFDDPPLVARMWGEIAGLEAEGGLELLLRYQEAGGAMADRMAGVRFLAGRMGALPAERVLVCPGAQGALLAIAQSMAAPGGVICVEALTYPGFRALAAQLGLRLVPVRMDQDGLLPEAFEEACAAHGPKALYCTPTLHNPTTATMNVARRKAVAEIARRYGVVIIEDDAYGALPRQALPPLSSFAPEISYYIAGLAKCLSPALRIAYAVAPDARAAARLAQAVRAMTSMASPLTAAIATRWIENGTAEAVLAAIRKETAARQQLAAAILPQGVVQGRADAFHLWMTLPAPWTRGAFTGRLRAAGIGVVSSDAFAIGDAPEAVRLSLGAPVSREELRECLRLIAELLGEQPAMPAMIV